MTYASITGLQKLFLDQGKAIKIQTLESELVDNLNDIQNQLRAAYCRFNIANDDELLESYIYEIKSLEARYNYAVRKLKEAM